MYIYISKNDSIPASSSFLIEPPLLLALREPPCSLSLPLPCELEDLLDNPDADGDANMQHRIGIVIELALLLMLPPLIQPTKLHQQWCYEQFQAHSSTTSQAHYSNSARHAM